MSTNRCCRILHTLTDNLLHLSVCRICIENLTWTYIGFHNGRDKATLTKISYKMINENCGMRYQKISNEIKISIHTIRHVIWKWNEIWPDNDFHRKRRPRKVSKPGSKFICLNAQAIYNLKRTPEGSAGKLAQKWAKIELVRNSTG